MKLTVCVKYVPVVAQIRFDAATKTILREGVPSEINPFDRLGVTCAVALKAEPAAEVVAISMGPPQAKEGLRHCLALSADRALLLTDRALAGSDTLATARAGPPAGPRKAQAQRPRSNRRPWHTCSRGGAHVPPNSLRALS